jgi:deazaflavin-dependent oxidoreductase (nitroreductase family)
MVDLGSRPAPTPYSEAVARLNMFGMETINVFLFRLSHGKIGGSVWGTPVILVTASGSHTGTRYTRPLLALPDPEVTGAWVVVASRGGSSGHPDWFRNLEAYEAGTTTDDGAPLLPPTVTADGGAEVEVRMTVLEGAERELWWERLVGVYPKFTGYQERIPHRVIPVLRLSPAH